MDHLRTIDGDRDDQVTSATLAALEASPAAVVAVSREGNVLVWNLAAESMFGWRRAEVLGRPLPIVPGELRGEFQAVLAARLCGATVTDVETRRLKRDGSLIDVSLSGAPLRDGDGNIRGALALFIDITERKRATAEAERRRQVNESLAALGQTLARSLDPRQVAERTVESARLLLDAPVARVYRVDPVSGDLRPLASAFPAGHSVGRDTTLPRGTGAAGLAVKERAAIATPDALGDPRFVMSPGWQAALRPSAYRAMLAVPLLVQERVVGALILGDRTGSVFAREKVELVEAFADYAAVALDNADLYEEARGQRRAAEVFTDLVATLNISLETGAVLQRVAEGALGLCQADMTGITLRDVETGAMVFRYTAGAPYRGWEFSRVVPGKGCGGIALATGRSSRTDDYANDPRFSERRRAIVREAGLGPMLVVPIKSTGVVEGLIYVCRSSPGPFGERDEAVLLRLADHAAIALRNARLLTDERVARAEAQSSVLRFRSLVEDLDAVVWEARSLTGPFTFVSHRAEGIFGYPVARWLEEPDFLREQLHPADREWVIAQRSRAEALGVDFNSEYRVLAADGRTIWILDRVHVVRENPDGPPMFRGLMVDTTSRRLAEEVRRGAAEQWAALAGLSQRALAGGDLSTLMDEACALVTRRLEVEYVNVLELLPDGSALLVKSGVGWKAGIVGQALIGVGLDSQAGYTLHCNVPVIVDDLHSETRFTPPPILRDHRVTSGMTVVIQGSTRPFGILGGHTMHRRTFSGGDVNFLQSVANVLGLALERSQTETDLRESTERLTTLREIDQSILAARSPEAIADGALRHLVRLLPCLQATVCDFDFEADEAMLLTVHAGSARPFVASERLPLGAFGDLGSLREGKVEIRVSAPALSRLALAGPREGVGAWVHVPLGCHDDLIGALVLGVAARDSLTAEHLDVARDVAGSLAVALQQARLNSRVWAGSERLRSLSRRLVHVQEGERRHLARELHDEIGQILTGLKLTLEGTSGCPDPQVREQLGRARAMVTDLMARVREISLDLRPTMLDDLGLVAALLWHFERYTAQTRVRVDFTHAGMERRRLAPEVETATYRIVQEALTNAARHAGVGVVTVQLRADELTLYVDVEDEGAGFVWNPAERRGRSGLVGMRERAALLRGRVEIESSPGVGTRVRAELPLAEVERRISRPR
jgi:PAS domain S-box-containing protein